MMVRDDQIMISYNWIYWAWDTKRW